MSRITATYAQLDLAECDLLEVRSHLAYWDSLRGDRFAPAWASFDWVEISSKSIPNFTVVDVSTDPLDFTYRFWGTNLARGQKQELTGHSVHDLKPQEEAVSIFNQFREVCEARKPLLFRSSVKGWMHVDLAGISLRMPFSDDGERVSQIVSCGDFEDAYLVLEKASDDPYGRVE